MTYLLRLSACLFLCVSLNSFGALLYGLGSSSSRHLYALDVSTGSSSLVSTIFDNNSSLVFSPVPLPAGIYLFLSGLVGLGLIRNKRRSNFK